MIVLWTYQLSLVPRPSPTPVFDRLQYAASDHAASNHAASDQKLESGEALERGYTNLHLVKPCSQAFTQIYLEAYFSQ